MKLEICIGSACHIKGSYDVIEKLRALAADYGMDCEIDMKACFCMGNCGEGVNVRINEGETVRITPDTATDFFLDMVKGR